MPLPASSFLAGFGPRALVGGAWRVALAATAAGSAARSAPLFAPRLATPSAGLDAAGLGVVGLGGVFGGAGTAFGAAWGGACSAVEALLSPIWLAVQKSKVSKSRRRKRGYYRRVKNITHMQLCNNCGKPKLRHHICMHCFDGKDEHFMKGGEGGELAS